MGDKGKVEFKSALPIFRDSAESGFLQRGRVKENCRAERGDTHSEYSAEYLVLKEERHCDAESDFDYKQHNHQHRVLSVQIEETLFNAPELHHSVAPDSQREYNDILRLEHYHRGDRLDENKYQREKGGPYNAAQRRERGNYPVRIRLVLCYKHLKHAVAEVEGGENGKDRVPGQIYAVYADLLDGQYSVYYRLSEERGGVVYDGNQHEPYTRLKDYVRVLIFL